MKKVRNEFVFLPKMSNQEQLCTLTHTQYIYTDNEGNVLPKDTATVSVQPSSKETMLYSLSHCHSWFFWAGGAMPMIQNYCTNETTPLKDVCMRNHQKDG